MMPASHNVVIIEFHRTCWSRSISRDLHSAGDGFESCLSLRGFLKTVPRLGDDQIPSSSLVTGPSDAI
jgi:hypothetical protein